MMDRCYLLLLIADAAILAVARLHSKIITKLTLKVPESFLHSRILFHFSFIF